MHEWIVDFGCNNCMAKDDSLFSSLSEVVGKQIVADGYTLTISSCGNILSSTRKRPTRLVSSRA